MKRDYLMIDEVLTMHETLIEQFGGDKGLRDRGALEAALFRPQSGYYQDIYQEAAALFESLVINHPFFDGNKRIGLATTHTFLQINGYQLTINEDKLYNWIIDLLSQSEFKFEKIETFLRLETTTIKLI